MADPRPIAFDLDGTLIDSRGDIAVSCNFALSQVGRAELPEETISEYVGDGARKLLERAFGQGTPEATIDEALQIFLDHYTANPAHHTSLMPGVERLLIHLEAGRRQIGICTNKPRRSTDAVLQAMQLTDRFHAVVAGDDAEHKKPHAAPLELLAQRFGCEPKAIIMVGDGPQDIEAARAAGCLGVGVKGGLLPLERLLDSKPDILLDSMEDFEPWLAQFDPPER